LNFYAASASYRDMAKDTGRTLSDRPVACDRDMSRPGVPTPGEFLNDVLLLVAGLLEVAVILHLIGLRAGW